MNTKLYHAKELELMLKQQKIATMEEMKKVLGTNTNITVFRKLKELNYHTSYSHGGRFYTIQQLVKFDEQGLWSYQSVYFSQHGTLLSTLEFIVNHSKSGYSVAELQDILHVGCKEALLQLINTGRLYREKICGRYLYCSSQSTIKKQQVTARRIQQEFESQRIAPESTSDELKAAIILFMSLLDEKQRRLYAGLESLRWGHGGDRLIANFMGIDVGTVSRGRRELIEQDVEIQRIRKPGGGRKSVEKKLTKS